MNRPLVGYLVEVRAITMQDDMMEATEAAPLLEFRTKNLSMSLLLKALSQGEENPVRFIHAPNPYVAEP